MSEKPLNIQMVDLKSQYISIKNEVDTAIHNVINSTQFINGDEVKSFQKILLNTWGLNM